MAEDQTTPYSGPDGEDEREEAASVRSPLRRPEEYGNTEPSVTVPAVPVLLGSPAEGLAAAARAEAGRARGRAEEHRAEGDPVAARAADADEHVALADAARYSAQAVEETGTLRAEAANNLSTTVNGPPRPGRAAAAPQQASQAAPAPRQAAAPRRRA